ncbi:MAG: hypothetical protein IJW00_10975 [Clostridia bacterium]|nr:hypothetical protein [Clostridia bacterium]MBQ9781448.1 hypothetical protein [Clostridia bacterium]
MSTKHRKPKDLLRPIWKSIQGLFRKFTRLPEEGIVSDEPIDFSAPSVPYYTGLAERFNLARIVLYMILFTFVVVTVLSSRHLITYENLYYLVKDVGAATLTAQSEADYLSYPISDAEADFAIYRGGLTVVGGQEITVLSGSGKQTLSENVSMSRPCVRAGEKTFLTFSRGENGFAVYNAFVRLHKELTEYPIYDGCMSAEGAFAILTRSREYTSQVVYYGSNMNVRAIANISGYVTALSISADGRTLAILSYDLTDTGYQSKLTLCMAGNPKEITVVTENTSALSAAFLGDNRLAVIFEDRLSIYKNDGSLVSETPFEDTVPLLCDVNDSYFALLCRTRDNLIGSVLQVYDKNGRSVYTANVALAGQAEEILLEGQNVYIRSREHILYVSGKGKKLSEATAHRDTLTLLVTENGGLLACGPAYAQRLNTEDFTEISQ